jgi:hypothetical protein
MRPLIGITTYVESASWGQWNLPAALIPYAHESTYDVLPGEYRYRLLLTQTGERSRDFQGKLQFVVNLQQDNKKLVMTLPNEDDGEAKGFTVETPEVNVIDQGTEFGVAVRGDRKSDVIVFQGKVDLRANGDISGSAKRLSAGEAARIDSRGTMARGVERLAQMSEIEIERLPGVTENVRFRMPAQLAEPVPGE